MKLRIAMDEKMLDVRLRDRLLAEGKISKKEVDDFLKSVSDDEGKYERVTGEEEAAESTEL